MLLKNMSGGHIQRTIKCKYRMKNTQYQQREISAESDETSAKDYENIRLHRKCRIASPIYMEKNSCSKFGRCH